MRYHFDQQTSSDSKPNRKLAVESIFLWLVLTKMRNGTIMLLFYSWHPMPFPPKRRLIGFRDVNCLGISWKYLCSKPQVLWSVLSKPSRVSYRILPSYHRMLPGGFLVFSEAFFELAATPEFCLSGFWRVLCSWHLNIKFYGFCTVENILHNIQDT